MTEEVKDRTGEPAEWMTIKIILRAKHSGVTYSIGFTAESLFPDNPAQ